MRIVSYAQEWEDVILYSVLKNIEKGFYIDIGAYDPVYMSVTKLFYEHEWNGINIEPLRSYCELLEYERPRDINLCIGIGDEDGELELVANETGSTFSEEIKKDLPQNKRCKKKIMTLQSIFETYCNEKYNIHFCKIDVEGLEDKVLKGIKSWDKYRPWIYVVESALPGTEIPCHEKWEHILFENGYKLALCTNINRYYVDERKDYLMAKFESVPDFLKSTKIMKMHGEFCRDIILKK
ncbi:hypothetical protein IMSAGC009_01390 [Lachnospiraceae bacterium]|nr:hypothetical protein IMSAGC009_01390 [Lachnospiraceae bacterium]